MDLGLDLQVGEEVTVMKELKLENHSVGLQQQQEGWDQGSGPASWRG